MSDAIISAECVKEFRLGSKWYNAMRRRLNLRFIIIASIMSFGLGGFLLWHIIFYNRTELILPGLVIIGSFAVACGRIPARNRRLARVRDSFRIILDDQYILRQCDGLAEMRIARSEVTGIEEVSGGDWIVRGSSAHHFIPIPRTIANFDSLAASLQAWTSIKKKPHRRFVQLARTLGICAAMILVLYDPFPWITVIIAPLLAALLIWSFIYMQRSPNVPARAKLVCWVLIFPLLSIVGAFCVALYQLLHPTP